MSIRMPASPPVSFSVRNAAAFSRHRFDHTRVQETGREVRHLTHGSACVTTSDASFRVELINLSQRGCAVSSPVSVMIGTSISIELPLVGVVAGQVRWSLGGRFGTAFTKRLSVDPLLVEEALLRGQS